MKRLSLGIALLLCVLPLCALAEPTEPSATVVPADEPTAVPEETSARETAVPLETETPMPTDEPADLPEETPVRETASPVATATPVPTPKPETYAPTASPAPSAAAVTPTPAAETAVPVSPTVPASFSGLRIDSETVYEDMDKSYSQGYIPKVSGGRVSLVLPLLGRTADDQVILSLDLGETSNSPFVYGNYNRTEKGKDGLYLFRFSVPLAKGRINGHYPILCKAEYLDEKGIQCEQTFTLYVTVTDGKDPPDPNAVTKETAKMPELFIHHCEIRPETVNGGESFDVSLEIGNIGNLRARNIKMTYGSETESIRPDSAESTKLLENTDPGEAVTVRFGMLAGEETLSGWHAFHVTLEYVDAYGGSYTLEQSFPIRVKQPASYAFDPPKAPEEAHAGETFSLPANVFNTGKSELRQVTVRAEGPGLFPVASAYLGDIAPGEAGYGEIRVFVGLLSMTDGYSDRYGMTNGTYTVSFLDEDGEEHSETVEFPLTILAPEIQPTPTPETEEKPTNKTGYTMSLWIGLALIVALASWIVTAQVLRRAQIGAHDGGRRDR